MRSRERPGFPPRPRIASRPQRPLLLRGYGDRASLIAQGKAFPEARGSTFSGYAKPREFYLMFC